MQLNCSFLLMLFAKTTILLLLDILVHLGLDFFLVYGNQQWEGNEKCILYFPPPPLILCIGLESMPVISLSLKVGGYNREEIYAGIAEGHCNDSVSPSTPVLSSCIEKVYSYKLLFSDNFNSK